MVTKVARFYENLKGFSNRLSRMKRPDLLEKTAHSLSLF